MKVGFVGAGQIGQALIQGLLTAGMNNNDIMVLQSQHATAQKVAEKYQLQLADSYSDLNFSDILIIAVPAKALADVMDHLKTSYHGIIVSTSGGDLKQINVQLPVDATFVKAVPNTPVKLDSGITAVSFIETESQANQDLVTDLFKKLGQVYVVPENLLGIYSTIAGCTPAFIDILMEALSDAAVMNGINRAQSYQIITQMLLGTAQLAQASGKHPGELKDEVTTPGGSTIRGVAKLEETGFRNALIQAVKAANE